MENSETVDLLGPNDIRELCRGLGIRPTKTLGQNFVTDANTVRKIADVAGLTGSEHVLEIGPGLGSLTLALLERGCAVTAVEIDPKLAQFLPQTIAARAPQCVNAFALVTGDALALEGPESLAAAAATGNDPRLQTPPTRVVANLPYNVAVPVVLRLLERFPSLEEIVVMVQAEVADRLSAGPGSRVYGVPSAKLAWYGSARRGITIGRGVFNPVPNVDSALVVIKRAENRTWKAPREVTFALIDAAFAQRRKTLRAALKRWLRDEWAVSPEAATSIYQSAGIAPERRGETLDITEFDALAAALVAAAAAEDAEYVEASGGVAATAGTDAAGVVADGALAAAGAQESVTAVAYGKVNLLLYCAAADARGYHPLTSIFQAVNLPERVTVSRTEAAKDTVTTVWVGQSQAAPAAGTLAQLDTEVEKHLAVRAARAVANAAGQPQTRFHVKVAKTVPIAGGMAGGSADAAAALIATNELLHAGLSRDELAEIARTLGADVPFCLYGGTALGTGYADHIHPLPAGPERHWVFALAPTGLSTPTVFTQIDTSGRGRAQLPELAPQTRLDAIDPDPARLAQIMHNDLEAATLTLRPELRKVIATAQAAGALSAIVSGSGPTIAALVADTDTAAQLAAAWQKMPEVAASIITTGPPAAAPRVTQATEVAGGETCGTTGESAGA